MDEFHRLVDLSQSWVDRFNFHTAPFNSLNLPIVGCTIYLCVAILLRINVTERYKVALFSKVHNLFLCLLSLLMMVGTLYHVVLISLRKNVFNTLCDEYDNPLGSNATGGLMFWAYVFYLSKFYEMLDTVLLVLKGRPLAFIHVYHHTIVPFLFWSFLSTDSTVHWILIVNNCAVHVIMYFYYLARSLHYDPWWKEYVTVFQIVQFFLDMTSTWPHIIFMFVLSPAVTGWRCWGSSLAAAFGQIVGLSFVYLFTSFYFKTYHGKTNNKNNTNTSSAINDEIAGSSPTLSQEESFASSTNRTNSNGRRKSKFAKKLN